MPITITTKGWITLHRDGALISQHTVESKAIEAALEHAEANGDGDYELRFPNKVLRVLLTKTVLPFRWSAITVSLTAGTATSVNVAQYLNNPDGRPVTFTVSGTLPTGATLSSAGLLTFNGATNAVSASVQFVATSGGLVAQSSVTTVSVAPPPLQNTAPVFSVAPATVELGSNGGTIQFTAVDPQGDTVSYSLPTTRTGITINASTGLVTVTSSAAGTAGSILVRASDGSLTADHSCAVTLAEASVEPVIVVAPSGALYVGINAAIAAANAGDIIEVWANSYPSGSNGSRTYTENALISAKTGTASQPITIRPRSGDTIMVKPASGTVLDIVNSSYITIEGADDNYGTLKFGDEAQWASGSGYTRYSHTRTADIRSASHHITLRDCTFSGAKNYSAIVVRDGCTHVGFDHCRFSRHGTQYDASVGYETYDGLVIWAKRTLVRNCVFDRFGGHDQVVTYRNLNAIHSNTFNAYWYDINPIAGQYGYRAASFHCNSHSKWSQAPDGNNPVDDSEALTFGPMFVGHNEFHSISHNYRATNAYKLLGWQVTSLGNLILDGYSIERGLWAHHTFDPVQAQGDGPGSNPRFGQVRVIHDTIYNFNSLMWERAAGDDGYTATGNSTEEGAQNRWANCIFQEIKDEDASNLRWYFRYNSAVDRGGYANDWKGSVVENNVISFQSGASKRINLEGNTKTLSVAQADWPDNFRNNTEAATLFTSIGSFRNRTKAGFLPTGGTGYNDAPALATITSGGGGATTSIVLSDAVWLYDPESATSYGLDYFGEQNDWLAYGSSLATAQLVQIATVNRTTGAVTLKTPIDAANGTSIWYGGNAQMGGAKVWRHRGAVQ